MEPVFMVLGQSAATAACLALEGKQTVQDIDISKLQERLLADGQVLEWTGPKREPPVDPKTLPGIVLDDSDAKLTGEWLTSRSATGYIGDRYLHDNNADKAEKSAVFTPTIPKAGRYDVRLSWSANPNRATNVAVVIRHADGEHRVTVNQKKPPKSGRFQSLGQFSVAAGKSGSVTILAAGSNGHVIVDAVQFLSPEAAKK